MDSIKPFLPAVVRDIVLVSMMLKEPTDRATWLAPDTLMVSSPSTFYSPSLMMYIYITKNCTPPNPSPAGASSPQKNHGTCSLLSFMKSSLIRRLYKNCVMPGAHTPPCISSYSSLPSPMGRLVCPRFFLDPSQLPPLFSLPQSHPAHSQATISQSASSWSGHASLMSLLLVGDFCPLVMPGIDISSYKSQLGCPLYQVATWPSMAARRPSSVPCDQSYDLCCSTYQNSEIKITVDAFIQNGH